MAKHTHVTHTCDRCGADVPEAWLARGEAINLDVTFSSITNASHGLTWTDLCERCDSAVRAFFIPSPLAMNVGRDERRDARVWWATVGAYVNEEMAEYIMVRARRIIGDWKP